MSPEQADEMIGLLRAIAIKLQAIPRPKRPPMTDDERRQWRELNRPRSAQADGEYPSSTVTREEFFRRKDV